MKNIFPLILLVIITLSVNAQKSKVTSASNYLNSGKLDKAKEAIDAGISHEKCIAWSKAYFVKGKVYQGIFESPLPAYKKLAESPLAVALEAYKKALSLDTKAKYKDEIKNQLLSLSNDFINDGVEEFNGKDYNRALTSFEAALDIKEMDLIKGSMPLDTAVIWNAGMAAQNAKLYDKAIKHYRMALEHNYGEAKAYARLYNCYTSNNQSEEALEYLHKGFEKYPKDSEMLVALINHYLSGGESEKAGEYLDQAIAMDPQNASFYNAKGSLYEKTKEFDKAVEMFHKAVELNPQDYTALFNLALMRYNQVIEHHKKANEIMDVKAYNEEFAKVLDEYKEVVSDFEKVLQVKPDEKNTMLALKELYFKLRSENEEYLEKYNKLKSKLELVN